MHKKFEEKRQPDDIIINARIVYSTLIEVLQIICVLKTYCNKNSKKDSVWEISGTIKTINEKLEYSAYKLNRIIEPKTNYEIPEFMKKMREVDILFDSEDDLL